jgi:hypothetical protein
LKEILLLGRRFGDVKQPIILVTEIGQEEEESVTRLSRVGLTT